MKKRILLVLGMGTLLAAAMPAVADVVYSIPPESTPFLINPAATSINVLEAFIEGSPGVSFAGSGFIDLNSGWTATASGNFAQEMGPASSYLNEILDVSGLVASLPVHLYGFSGCVVQPGEPCGADTLVDGYSVTFANGVYPGYSPLTVRDFAAEVQPVPEAGTFAAMTIFLVGIGAALFRKKVWQI